MVKILFRSVLTILILTGLGACGTAPEYPDDIKEAQPVYGSYVNQVATANLLRDGNPCLSEGLSQNCLNEWLVAQNLAAIAGDLDAAALKTIKSIYQSQAGLFFAVNESEMVRAQNRPVLESVQAITGSFRNVTGAALDISQIRLNHELGKAAGAPTTVIDNNNNLTAHGGAGGHGGHATNNNTLTNQQSQQQGQEQGQSSHNHNKQTANPTATAGAISASQAAALAQANANALAQLRSLGCRFDSHGNLLGCN